MASLFEQFDHAVCAAVPLASTTSFRIGGPAEFFVEPESLEELAALVRRCAHAGVPFRMLGGGSNILAPDRGVAGAVFRLSRLTAISRSGRRITCEAGASLPRLVRKAEHWGLSGLEGLAGIPGTVGGAVAMNAGGKHGSIGARLGTVTTVDRYGILHDRAAKRLGLGYRRSNLHGETVVGATFELNESAPTEIAGRRVAVLEEKARSQPLTAWSAGCIFKNWKDRGAGEVIDLAGLKGERCGRAVVSSTHANFILNEGGATSQDVRRLIGRVRRRVRQVFGIDLELEIEVWN
jgi:UDP-N-acetylmuramate dehydrogenase